MISIIVPVYKVEKYIHRCVNSILSQTYAEFELILVDDGSPDRCGEICEQYAGNDERISVIHKENGGLSDARNAGLKIAHGEYICFIDSDDWIAPGYLELMLNALEITESDICECGVLSTEKEDIDTDASLLKNADASLETYMTQEALLLLIEDKILHQHVWNKLYRRKCLDGIFFPVGKTNEDEFWTYQVISRARRVVKIPEVLYFYYQRGGSIMGSGYNLKRLDALEAKVQRQHYVEDHYPELKKNAEANLFTSCIYSGQMTLMYLKGEEKKEAKQKIDQIRCNCRWKEIRSVFRLNGKVWGSLANINFWGLCKLKNLLKRGF